MSLHGKVVILTGATGALGRHLLEALALNGAAVACCGRQFNELYRIECQFAERGCKVHAFACDVRYEDEVVRLVHRVVQRFGRLDCLINGASMVGPRTAIIDYPIEPWRDVLATNLTAAYVLSREVLPWMTRQRSGSIINVTSSVAHAARPGWGAFVASKCGLEGLTRMLAEEVRDCGIRVNLVDFGTPGGELPDIHAAVPPFLWLASDASAHATGRRICVSEFGPDSTSV